MSIRQLLASLSFAATFLSPLMAAPHCPGKIAGLPMRIVQGSMIVVPLQIDGGGPYDFLVDTGAQISTVDASLASELRLGVKGTTGISGAGNYSRHNFAYLGRLQTGSNSVSSLLVAIQDLAQLRAADPHIRGILGDNFLEHFDLLIDNRQHILCLDGSNTLALAARGERVALMEPYGPANDLPFTRPIVVTGKISGLVETPLLLRLDSGSNAAMLHVASPQMRAKINSTTQTLRRRLEGAEQIFAVLPGQNLEIGKHHFRGVAFVVPMNSSGNGPDPREDGILPTMTFQSVFISSTGRYAAFEAW